jgi:hypothetical protein
MFHLPAEANVPGVYERSLNRHGWRQIQAQATAVSKGYALTSEPLIEPDFIDNADVIFSLDFRL